MSIQKVLRTVYHYFVTEQRSRNAVPNGYGGMGCVYDGEKSNGVGCAVGCCLTRAQAIEADKAGIDTLYRDSTDESETKYIYEPLGLVNTTENRNILSKLQETHDYSGPDAAPLAERMKETILSICQDYNIPPTILTDGGEMYTK